MITWPKKPGRTTKWLERAQWHGYFQGSKRHTTWLRENAMQYILAQGKLKEELLRTEQPEA